MFHLLSRQHLYDSMTIFFLKKDFLLFVTMLLLKTYKLRTFLCPVGTIFSLVLLLGNNKSRSLETKRVNCCCYFIIFLIFCRLDQMCRVAGSRPAAGVSCVPRSLKASRVGGGPSRQGHDVTH